MTKCRPIKFKVQIPEKELSCHLHTLEVADLWINCILMEWPFVAKLDFLISSSLLLAIPIGQKFSEFCLHCGKSHMIDQTLSQECSS
jgi:hypothetical protein